MSKPRIFSRKEWGAKHANGFGRRPETPSAEYLHHSVTVPGSGTWKGDVAAVRTLENIGEARFHQGISYNYPILPSGRIFEGVSVNRIGAHTAGRNTRGVGYVFVGNYQNMEPTWKQLASLIRLRLWLKASGRLHTKSRLWGHRDTKATACPGNAAYALINAVNLYHRPVKMGMTGADVAKVKARLKAHGYVKSAVAAFGPATRRAVIRFQQDTFGKDNGGVVGPGTYAALIRKKG